MDSFLELSTLKVNQIQTNLLDVLSALNRYQKERSVDGHQSDGHQWTADNNNNKVLVNKTILESIQLFVAKVSNNLDQLSQLIDKTSTDRERIGQQLSQCLKREVQYKKQLSVLRDLYKETKDKSDQMQLIQEMYGSNGPTSGCGQQMNDYFKNSLALILSSTQNQKTVQSITENQEIFNSFMETLLSIVQKFIADMSDVSDFDPNPYDTNLIESICGICVNVFLYSEYLCKDINVWIQSLTSLQMIDKRYLKNVIMALNNICFLTGGSEEVAKQKGVIEMMARVLTDPDFRCDYKLKTCALKAIRRMIEVSKGSKDGIDIFLYSDFTAVISINRFQQMAYLEPNVNLKKAMTALYHSLSPLAMDGIED